jgi:RNA polymerase sigma-70 factor (ECF subfamily)
MTDQQFEAIFNLYKQDVMAIAFYYLRHQQDAEDVTMQVFGKFYSEVEVDPSLVKPYLLKMAANASLDWIRKRKATLSFDETILTDENVEGNPEESRLLLAKALGQLPKKLAMALTLVYLSETPVNEAAKVLGCSEMALRKRLLRGKKQLKEVIDHDNRRNLN